MVELRREPAGTTSPTDDETARWGAANESSTRRSRRRRRNDVLVATLTHLHRSYPRDLTRVAFSESTTLLAENVREHEAILDAIERRDAASARALMVDHVLHAGRLVTLRFEQRAAASPG